MHVDTLLAIFLYCDMWRNIQNSAKIEEQGERSFSLGTPTLNPFSLLVVDLRPEIETHSLHEFSGLGSSQALPSQYAIVNSHKGTREGNENSQKRRNSHNNLSSAAPLLHVKRLHTLGDAISSTEIDRAFVRVVPNESRGLLHDAEVLGDLLRQHCELRGDVLGELDDRLRRLDRLGKVAGRLRRGSLVLSDKVVVLHEGSVVLRLQATILRLEQLDLFFVRLQEESKS